MANTERFRNSDPRTHDEGGNALRQEMNRTEKDLADRQVSVDSPWGIELAPRNEVFRKNEVFSEQLTARITYRSPVP